VDEQEIKRRQDKIPPLYSQDSAKDPIVYWHYCFPLQTTVNVDSMEVRQLLGFQNLLTEYDPETGDAFGWGMIQGDLQNAELGYANVYELERCGMRRDPLWEPCEMSLAKRKVTGYMEPKGHDDHYLWWQHFYKRHLDKHYANHRLNNETFDDFSRRLYRRLMEDRLDHE
jgi:hypothetical protein